MAKIILYYSFSGTCKKIANDLSIKDKCVIKEVTSIKKYNTLSAYTIGCFKAMSQKKEAINKIDIDLNKYNVISIFIPIWAGSPAPVFNSIIELLPKNKNIEVFCVSGSGKSKSKDKVTKLIEDHGCHLKRYQDLKAND